MLRWIKKILGILAQLLFLLALLGVALWQTPLRDRIKEWAASGKLPTQVVEPKIEEREALSQPVSLTASQSRQFEWSYRGKEYKTNLTLYESLFQAYQEAPKEYRYTGELPLNWAEEYYALFLKQAPNDSLISELADRLKAEATKQKLSPDQTVELAMAFVQSIPYDDAKARNILAGSGDEKPRYPYEVLYEKLGVCSGKSFLAYSLLRELSYGVTFFEYEADKHIAIGIKCPQEYSTYGSGYCYAETTASGNKIGIIPQFDAQSNVAEPEKELEYFKESDGVGATKTLGTGKMYLATDGSTYQGIVATIATQQEIEKLRGEIEKLGAELKTMKGRIVTYEQDIEALQKKMEKLQDNGDYKSYNKQVPKYNALVAEYKKFVGSYNAKVKTYNQKVDRYNKLVKEFNGK